MAGGIHGHEDGVWEQVAILTRDFPREVVTLPSQDEERHGDLRQLWPRVGYVPRITSGGGIGPESEAPSRRPVRHGADISAPRPHIQLVDHCLEHTVHLAIRK